MSGYLNRPKTKPSEHFSSDHTLLCYFIRNSLKKIMYISTTKRKLTTNYFNR